MPPLVVSAAEMRAAEEAAFARGSTPDVLMTEAATGIAQAVSDIFPTPGTCLVFAGKGNNAGDAFAAATHLCRVGWRIDLRLAFAETELGELARTKLAHLEESLRSPPSILADAAGARSSALVILDGLLGLGSRPPLREPIRDRCRQINQHRSDDGAYVFAIDSPSGLDADLGDADTDCVTADCTLAIGFVKRGLLADQALDLVGRIVVVELPTLQTRDLPERAESERATVVTTAAGLRPLLPRRRFSAYKNNFGRVGIVAGSKGFTGAAVLCSLGALRGGAGLVELFVPEQIYAIVAATAAPEVMVKSITSCTALADEPIDVWAVGPGLGRTRSAEILRLIEAAQKPMVLDADALNILSQDMRVLARSGGPRLLTPHPGEMKRMFPVVEKSRLETAQEFCTQHPVTLLLKGSRTIVAQAGQPISYNTTGNPGMATGGMGDVLTGVCAGLIGQRLSLYDAARVGAWICGRAAELAVSKGSASEQSLLPSDILDHLGLAFRALQR